MIDEMTKETEKAIYAQYRVYCLTVHPDSTLMWAYYGRAHTGVCLEFSVGNELFCGALPVEYLDHYPVFNVCDDDEDANLRPLLTKSSAWTYEDEFRIVCTEFPTIFPGIDVTRQGFLTLPTGALKGVIVGCQMPPKERAIVRSLVEACPSKVAFREARIVRDRYVLEIQNA
jgi:hypothetical protein